MRKRTRISANLGRFALIRVSFLIMPAHHLTRKQFSKKTPDKTDEILSSHHSFPEAAGAFFILSDPDVTLPKHHHAPGLPAKKDAAGKKLIFPV